jgi:NADH dehydrogenase FAD-containing subunit
MARVVIVGGGYGGTTVAKALDTVAEVVLVEPKEAFHHNVASLRALVSPDWPARMFLPYDRLLTRGSVVRDRAVEVSPERVLLASGTELTADYIVLATGSSYPFPAKTDRLSTVESLSRYASAGASLSSASRVLLLGAGAVGLELAGEISAAFPGTHVTLVDPAPEILPGPYSPALRHVLRSQLSASFVLGSPLAAPPPVPAGVVQPFSVTTVDGRVIEALAAARSEDGYLSVTPSRNVVGCPTVYAVGDIVTGDANRVSVARAQAEVVAANISAAQGGGAPAVYAPLPAMIVLPLGPSGGAGQRDTGEILPAAIVSQVKGTDLFLARYHELFNLTP